MAVCQRQSQVSPDGSHQQAGGGTSWLPAHWCLVQSPPSPSCVQAMEDGQGIVIDLDFEEHMTETEAKSLCGQLQYCHSSNTRSAVPCHLYFTSMQVQHSVRFFGSVTGVRRSPTHLFFNCMHVQHSCTRSCGQSPALFITHPLTPSCSCSQASCVKLVPLSYSCNLRLIRGNLSRNYLLLLQAVIISV